MKTQAIKCSKSEILWLIFWRRHGYSIGRNQPIPRAAKITSLILLNRRAILQGVRTFLLGALIIAGICGLCMLWLGKASGAL